MRPTLDELTKIKAQGEVFQTELIANIEKSSASHKTFIAQLKTRHTAERDSLNEQLNKAREQLKTLKKDAKENKEAFEALALAQADWESEKIALNRELDTMSTDLTNAKEAAESNTGYLSETTEHISYLKSRVESLEEALSEAKMHLEPMVQNGLIASMHDVAINPGEPQVCQLPLCVGCTMVREWT